MHVPARRFLSVSFFLLVSWLAVGPAATAFAAGTVSGQVVDPDGRPISGARVLLSSGDLLMRSTVTDSDGRFSVESPDADRAAIRIAAEGFSGQVIPVNAPANADLGTIRLSIGAISESIVVSSSQIELPLTQVGSSVTIITGAELELQQLHTGADALRSVPGLTLVSTGGIGTTTGLFPRGGESNYTLALIDGVAVNAFGGDFDFGQLSTANIERIEIVRGPQSALFGSNAIGAVIQIVTRRGGRPTGQVHAEGGAYGTSRVSASTTGEHRNLEWGAGYDQLLSDGMEGKETRTGQTITNDDYERRTGMASLGWRRDHASIRADVRHSEDDRGFPGPFGSNPIGAYDGVDLVSRGTNERSTASLSAALPLFSRLRLQGQLGYNRLQSDFTSRFGGSESSSRRWAGRAQVDAPLHDLVTLSSGFELQRERAGSTFITGSAAQEIPIERRTAGYFGELRWNWRDRVFASTGLRIEDIRRERIEPNFSRPDLSTDRVVSTNPRISVAWLPSAGTSTYTRIRGAIGTGIRPPDAFELAFTDNPELRPERSRSAEIGVDRSFGSGRALVEATTFFNDYDDLIVVVGSFASSSRYRSDNISNARARGLELALTLRGRVAARRPLDLSGKFGYTWLATKILAVDRDDAAPPPFSVGQPLLRRPSHQFFADVSASISAFTLFLHGGGRSTVLDVEPSLGTFGGLFDASGYQAWNAGGSFRVTKYAELFARVENLFDRSYEEALGFPALGRRAMMGLRVAPGR